MNCKYCGAEMPEGSKYCPECGSNQESEPVYTNEKLTDYADYAKEPVTTSKAYKDNGGIMFSNIGSKMCGLAKVFFWIIFACGAFSAFSVIVYASNAVAGVIAGIMILAFFTLIGWLSSISLYAAGDLNKCVHRIEEYLRDKE
ncbi:MAG: zinc ribbon domain-containing protein [Erysipelotrichaceae bacterium]|nr:zinc ribbon domain-containing protein [Erysipelotrichaceae bacterium]